MTTVTRSPAITFFPNKGENHRMSIELDRITHPLRLAREATMSYPFENAEGSAFGVAAKVHNAACGLGLDIEWTDLTDGTEIFTLRNGFWLALGYDDLGDPGQRGPGGYCWSMRDSDGNVLTEGGWGEGEPDEIDYLARLMQQHDVRYDAAGDTRT